MGSFWNHYLLIFSLLAVLQCNQWHLTKQDPIVSISQYKQDAPNVISLSGKLPNIQVIKRYQPVYLNDRISASAPEPNRIQYSSDVLRTNPSESERQEVINIDYVDNRLNSIHSNQLDSTQLSILKGMQKLVQQSNDKVIGRLNTLENRLDRVILERNSIIGAINVPKAQLSSMSVPSPSLYQATQPLSGNIIASKVIYSPGFQSIGRNYLSPDSEAQILPCSIISGQNGPQCNQEKERIQPQTLTTRIDRAVDETQRRIDSLEAVMLARQRKMIMSRLGRDYNLGEFDQLQGNLPFKNYPAFRTGLDLSKSPLNFGQSFDG